MDDIKADRSTPKAKAAMPKRPRAESDYELVEAGMERRSKRAVVVERNVEREQEERQRAKIRKPVRPETQSLVLFVFKKDCSCTHSRGLSESPLLAH